MKQPKKKRVRNARMFLSIDPDLRAQLRQLAGMQNRTMVAVVRVLVRDAIERSESR